MARWIPCKDWKSSMWQARSKHEAGSKPFYPVEGKAQEKHSNNSSGNPQAVKKPQDAAETHAIWQREKAAQSILYKETLGLHPPICSIPPHFKEYPKPSSNLLAGTRPLEAEGGVPEEGPDDGEDGSTDGDTGGKR